MPVPVVAGERTCTEAPEPEGVMLSLALPTSMSLNCSQGVTASMAATPMPASAVPTGLQAPPVEFGGPLQVFEGALKHEQLVTSKIHALYEMAQSSKDYATEVMLHWFISEQVEEEASAGEVVERIKAVGDQGGAIWYLDKELGKRSES